MEDALRKFLGLSRNIPRPHTILKQLRKIFSLKLFLIFLAISLLVTIYFLHVNYEYIMHPETVEDISVDEVSPYFLSFFWILGTFIAGYAEAPYSTVGRILDLIMMLIGMSTFATIVSTITSRIVAANVSNMFGMARMKNKKIDYILCGWNPITESALEELQGTSSEIVVIDKENRPELAKAKSIYFIAGDPTNPDILRRSNVVGAKNIVLAMEEDSDVLLAIHVIRDLNPWINIVAKINHHEHIKIAESAGADQVVSPSSIGGRLLSMVTEEPAAVEWLIRATSGEKGMQLTEYHVTKDSVFANKSVGHIRKELKDKAKIIGIDTAKGLEKVPSDDMMIEPGNKLLMLIDSSKFDIE